MGINSVACKYPPSESLMGVCAVILGRSFWSLNILGGGTVGNGESHLAKISPDSPIWNLNRHSFPHFSKIRCIRC